MATTYSYSVPDMSYNGQNGSWSVYTIPNQPNSALTFSLCRNSNNEIVFHKDWCGNPTSGSWITTFKAFYDLDWASDTSITSSSNIVFPVSQSDTGAYVVDWNNPITMSNPYDYSLNVANSNIPLVGGISHTVEDSSSGSGSTEPSVPCDNPYGGVISAIHTAAAVPIVLCFFWVIYKMFMRLRG